MNSPVIQARPKTNQELRQIQIDLYELSKPFVRAKCDVLAVSIPTITYYPETGLFETRHDNWTVAKLAYYDALWREARESYLARNAPELSTVCP
jgi:hypothetical protein